MSYALPILFRYLSMVLQFATFIFVARRLSPHDTGLYFEVYGFVNTTYFLAGLGLPDGLVRFVSHARAVNEQETVRPLVRRAMWITAVLSVVMAVIVYFKGSHDPVLREMVALWWLCYAAVFLGSQVLVALGRTSLGAFFFYPVTSIALFFASVPYLAFSHEPNIQTVMKLTVVAAFACGLASIICVLIACRDFPDSKATVSLRPVFKLGFSIGLSRVLQTALYWIPVWAVGWALGAAQAGSMGTASRLNSAIGAVMAAIRFTIRPSIVKYAAKGDWESIGLESRQVATVASASTIMALVTVLLAGPWILSTIFGHAYRDAGPLLAVLLLGTLGECFGGPVDEILKMTGRAGTVMMALIVTATVEGGLVMLVARHGIMAISGAQSFAFIGMYAFMLWLVWKLHRVYVGATVLPSQLRSLPPEASAGV